MPNRLTIESRFDQLPRLVDWVGELAASHPLSRAVAYRLDLVLTEAVTNIIEHGCDNGREPCRIILDCWLVDQAIEVEIRDNARAFDPTRHPGLLHGLDLHEASPGGRGIHLMRQCTIGIHYRREDECNILTLSFDTG